MKYKIRGVAVLTASMLALAALTACTSGSTSPTKTNGVTEITVFTTSPGAPKPQVDFDNKQIAAFNKAHPNIKVTGKQYQWTAQSFSAQLAGGTLPSVFWVPFTESALLIKNKQIANMDSEFKTMPWAGDINKNVWRVGMSDSGQVYGFPFAAYSMAIHYNRSLFKAAGLDPDHGPTTWQEVRADAAAIAKKTGKTGFGVMATGNNGGWGLTTMIYSMGGTVEKLSGKKYVPFVDNEGAKQALGLLQKMRWEDNSLGSNFLYNGKDVVTDFAAGKIGMILHVSSVYYTAVINDGMSPADYGLTALPTDNGGGSLSGGNIAAVSVKATPAQKAAAAEWLSFFEYQGSLKKSVAVSAAKAAVASKSAVGVPTLPIFSGGQLDQYNEWIAPYVNVPLDQMTGYTQKSAKQKLIPEPPVQAQAVYGLLDTVVQKVLTQKDADISTLLSNANKQIQSTMNNG